MMSMGLDHRTPFWAWLAAVYLVQATSPFAGAADRIVLRNLNTLTERTVEHFDPDGVRLDDGTWLKWDDIETARVADAKQPPFDQMRKELGEPLYRIRQRLSVGDYRGALPHAEGIYPQYAERSSATAYMVLQSLMWGRLAVGRREEALEPYLWCAEYLRQVGGSVSLPGERRLAYDARTGLSPELLPVWFDGQAAEAALPAVFAAVGRMRRPRPEGANIYYATLALAAGQVEQSARVLGAMSADEPVLRELRAVVEAQREVATGKSGEALQRLAAQWPAYGSYSQPLALYWLGLGAIEASGVDRRQEGLLYLLRIPALYGNHQPALAGAALYHSMKALEGLDDVRGSVSVRRELLERYGHTYFAGRIAAHHASPPKEN